MAEQGQDTRRVRRELNGAARRLRRHRILALASAGSVFGVGSIITLAAWNDSEHASAELTAGEFALLGSTDGVTYADHTADDPAQLTFDLDASGLGPGSTAHALFSVSTTEESLGGSVEMLGSAESDSGLGAYLTYGVSQISGTDCNAESFAEGGAVVAEGSALSGSGTDSQELAAGGEDAVNYCFRITLPEDAPNGAQGQAVSASWEFFGTSG